MSHSADIVPAQASQAAIAPDWSIPRLRMVDTQIRPVKVNDPRILDAMRRIPRERFVLPDRADVAYMDQDIPLLDGRVLTEPRVIARLVQALVPHRGERALVIAAGTGYAACLLDALQVDVVALEQHPALATHGRQLLAELAPRVQYREGLLADGVADTELFDIILLDGAVREIPAALAAQLRPGGRFAGILTQPGALPIGILAEKQPSGLRPRAQFDCATPLLPELAPPPTFRF